MAAKKSAKKSARKSEKQISTVCIFHVTLTGRSRIWRRIAVGSGQTLEDLHDAVFDAFDRDEEHLYAFYFPHPGKSIPAPSQRRSVPRNVIEYAHPMCAEEDGGWGDEPVRDATLATLESLDLRPRKRFLYLFDFGDSWMHDIVVEKVDVPAEPGRYPRILESHGKSPPQYQDFDEGDEFDD